MSHDWRWDLVDDGPYTHHGSIGSPFMDEDDADREEKRQQEGQGRVGFQGKPVGAAGKHRKPRA